MLVNSIKLLQQARQNGNFVPAFNIYNLETAQAVLSAAAKVNKPVIAAFGEGYLQNASLPVIAAIVKTVAASHRHPVVLHLDHCKNIDTVTAAIEAGFTSVMYDGSQLPLAENIKNTRTVVQFAHARGISVEGELGCMNAEDGSSGADGCNDNIYTDAEQAEQYVRKTGIDSLAVVIGNRHGLYKGTPELNMQRLKEIYNAVRIPLVLHGCSGIPAEQLKQAAAIAVAKINVNTEIALAGSSRIKDLLAGEENIRMDKLMLGARQCMTEVIQQFLMLTD